MKAKSIVSKMPHTFVLLFLIIIICGLLSYVIPSGQFERVETDGRVVVVPGSFQYSDMKPIGIFDYFRALPYGMVEAASIMVICFMLGGSMEIINKTDSINIGISKSIVTFGEKGANYLILGAMVAFTFIGGFLGLVEGAIPFVPLAVSLAMGLGYDSLVGVAIAIIAGFLAFSAGPTNPYTVGTGHSIAGLPLFSGISYRIIICIMFAFLGIHHVMKYARKIKEDPSLSLMKGIDMGDLKFDIEEYMHQDFTIKHKTVIAIIILIIIGNIYGTLNLGWSLNETGAIFLVGAVISGILSGISVNKMAKYFAEGASKITSGALVIGIARGIQWTLALGGIQDTIINALASILIKLPTTVSAVGMFVVQTIINFFVPSGSGQAMATLPIMIPLSDLIGITRQTAILAFQFGDGLSNTIIPTLGSLLIYLAFGKVPYDRWLKFMLPLFLKVSALAAGFIVIAVAMNFGPF